MLLISIQPEKSTGFLNLENASSESAKRVKIRVRQSENPDVAVIPVKGYAYDTENWKTEFGLGFSYEGLERQIDEAVSMGAKTILFDISTPGGYGIGAESLTDKIFSLRQQGIKTIAQVHNLCCSAGYRLASQCEQIYAPSDALVGCLGTYTVVYDESKLYEKEGVKAILISSGGIKGVGAAGTEITDEYKETLQKQVSALNSRFMEEVRRGRPDLNEKQVEALFNGETWLGKEAFEKGLVDKRQTLAQTMKSFTSMEETMNEEHKEVQQESATPVVENATVEQLDSFKSATADFKLECLRAKMTLEQAREKYIEYLESENARLTEEKKEQTFTAPAEQDKHEEMEDDKELTLPGNTAAVNTAGIEMVKTTAEIAKEMAKKLAADQQISYSDAMYQILSENRELAEKLNQEESNG